MTRGDHAIIGRRALNRALLARQLLPERHPMALGQAPYVGLWTTDGACPSATRLRSGRRCRASRARLGARRPVMAW
jgi:hypothetical protein